MVNLELEIESVKGLREDLCVAMSAISNTYGQRRSDYVMGKIGRLQKIVDQLDILRPLGPDGKHRNRHTEFCGCEDNPILKVLTEWRDIPYFEDYELSGRGAIREKTDPQVDSYLSASFTDGDVEFNLWGGVGETKNLYRILLSDLMDRVFPELSVTHGTT